MKRRRKEKRRNRKNKEVHQKQSSKTKRRYFSYVGEMSLCGTRILHKREMWSTIRIFKIFWKSRHSFFKNGHKRNRKKSQTLQNEGFFFCSNVEKTTKSWRCECWQKNSENHRNHKEGQTEQDKMCLHKKENNVKNGGKRIWTKNEDRNIQGEDKNHGRNKKRRKEIEKKGVEKKR